MDVTVIAIVVIGFLPLTMLAIKAAGSIVIEIAGIKNIEFSWSLSRIPTPALNRHFTGANSSLVRQPLPGRASSKSRQLISSSPVLSNSKNIHI